jgi:hypothetical protein
MLLEYIHQISIFPLLTFSPILNQCIVQIEVWKAIRSSMVGRYELSIVDDFAHLPVISFLKAPTYEDGHPIDSTPADEQKFLVNTINRLQSLPEWNSTAVIITYDDSGG